MSSIKDVAKKANVSISTVSIILNGKSEQRKISSSTVDRVKKAMVELNYQPNVSAKKLRSNSDNKTIALYWTNDFRGIMLSQFINGLQMAISENNLNYDIIIYPYQINHLKDEPSIKNMNYSAAIIANCASDDLEYLNSISPLVPICLYNRQLANYHSVYVDDKDIALLAFEQLKDNKNVALVKAPAVFEGMKTRNTCLKQLLQENSINTQEYQLDDNSASDALKTASMIDYHTIDSIYCDSDIIALGIMHYCYENHIQIPQDIKIIAIGNALNTISEYLNPSLTIIKIPLEQMAKACISSISSLINNNKIDDIKIKPETIIRRSNHNGRK